MRIVEVVGVVEVALDKVSLVLIICLIALVDVSDYVLVQPMRKTDTQTIRVFVSEVYQVQYSSAAIPLTLSISGSALLRMN